MFNDFDNLDIFKDLKTQELIDDIFKKTKKEDNNIFKAIIEELKIRLKK